MNPPPDDPWLNGLANVVLVASVATWIYLVAKWLRDGVLVEYCRGDPCRGGRCDRHWPCALALLTIASAQTLGEAERHAVAQDSRR